MPIGKQPRQGAGHDLIPRAALAELLASALGEAKAVELVDRAARELGIFAPALTRDQSLEVLGRLADDPGLVGITARFARGRLHLAQSMGQDPTTLSKRLNRD